MIDLILSYLFQWDDDLQFQIFLGVAKRRGQFVDSDEVKLSTRNVDKVMNSVGLQISKL